MYQAEVIPWFYTSSRSLPTLMILWPQNVGTGINYEDHSAQFLPSAGNCNSILDRGPSIPCPRTFNKRGFSTFWDNMFHHWIVATGWEMCPNVQPGTILHCVLQFFWCCKTIIRPLHNFLLPRILCPIFSPVSHVFSY